MPQPLLSSFKHFCFKSPRCNVHQHPDLYRCNKGSAHGELMKTNKAVANHPDRCTASIHETMAKQAGLMDEKGNVSCPICGGPTTLVPGEKIAEIHARLCIDETIHYPEMHKAGKLNDVDYASWKATLTPNELMGYYSRIEELPVMAKFTHEETALMTSDLAAFNVLLQTRLKERAENALLHQFPYRHVTTTPKISL